MAQTEQKKPATGTPGKRLARAKIKRPETEAEKEKRKADRKKTIESIAISIFAIILVLSMLVPSLAALVSNARHAKAVSNMQSGEVTAEQIDAMYSANVEAAEAALSESPNDKDAILELANQYLSWGYSVSYYATDDAAATHSAELFSTARDYFDRYLEIEDSADVRANRALCSLYGGQITEAQTELEEVVANYPDCASAWANLGMIYEMTNPDAAAMAYERAIAASPNTEEGAGAYAQSRLDALQAQAAAVEAVDGEGEEAEATTDTDAEASGTND